MSEHNESKSGRDNTAAEKDRPQPRTVAEWTTLAVSAVVVLLLVGAAIAEIAFRSEPEGPTLTIDAHVDAAETRDGQTTIPFTVRNRGASAASAVVAIIEFRQGDTVVEDATIDIDLLGSHDSADGSVMTTLELSAHTVEARIVSMQDP